MTGLIVSAPLFDIFARFVRGGEQEWRVYGEEVLMVLATCKHASSKLKDVVVMVFCHFELRKPIIYAIQLGRPL